jgi:glycosyltransferase involved in cell wall biosynthesis
MKNGNIRVLNLCETARGGVGTYQRYIAQLEERGFEMHYVVPAPDADFLGQQGRVVTFHRERRGLGAVRAMLHRFQETRRTVQPDVCFFHSSFALAGLASLRARRLRTPALYCPHGWAVATMPDGAPKARLLRQIEGRLSGLADRVICVSHHEAEIARRYGYRGRFEVIENAVPDAPPGVPDDLFAAEPEALHLLFVGRLDRQKGFDILAEALRIAERPDIRLHVIGGAVRDGRGAVDLPPGVDMIGWVSPDAIHPYYRSADALVVPSRWEGLPLAIPEALRNGTPVLCSDRSGMPDLIEEGQTGYSAPLDAAALAQRLRSLDKAQLRAMRPACRAAYSARFSMPRLLDALETQLREVAARNG